MRSRRLLFGQRGRGAAMGLKMRGIQMTLLATVAVVLGTSCSSSSPSGPVMKYVALGDSYASGEANPPFDKGTAVPGRGGDDCHRSSKAYPRVLKVNNRLNVVHKACSGAVTQDILDHARFPSEPPQVSWLDSTADVVTI